MTTWKKLMSLLVSKSLSFKNALMNLLFEVLNTHVHKSIVSYMYIYKVHIYICLISNPTIFKYTHTHTYIYICARCICIDSTDIVCVRQDLSAAELVGNVDVGSLDVGRSESMNFSLPQNDLPSLNLPCPLKNVGWKISFPFGARPILRCELLVSGGLQIFCGNYLDEEIFREKGHELQMKHTSFG